MKKIKITFSLLVAMTISNSLFAQFPILDNSFATAGVATKDLNNGENIFLSSTLQTDGKIIAVGSSLNTINKDIAIARFKVNGTLDSTFGTNGITLTNVENNDEARSVALQSDGKIVVAGISTRPIDSTNKLAVCRYKTNGTLDSTFGTNGIVNLAIGAESDEANSIAIASDGKIVLGGVSLQNQMTKNLIVRLNSNGTLDNTFNSTGSIIQSFGATDISSLSTIAVLSNNYILTGGYSLDFNTFMLNAVLAKFKTNGTLDSSFATNGVYYGAPISNNFYAITQLKVLSDGKIITAGGNSVTIDSLPNFAAVKFNANGTLDNTFGTNGSTIIMFNSNEDMATSLVVDASNKIILGGCYTDNAETDFALVRLNSNGALDNTFGINGMVKTKISTENDGIASMNLQSDGKLVVAGYSTSSTSGIDFCIARYTFSFPTSTNDVSINNAIITISPNPFTNNLKITSSEKVKNVTIIDLNGRKFPFTIENETIQTQNLVSGIYFVTVETEKNIQTIKLIKKD